MRNFQLTACLIAAITLGLLLAAKTGRADEPAPKLYGFCMEMHDAKKRTIPQQAEMLRELGFDGVGYPLWLDENLEKNLAILDKAKLPVYHLYMRANVKPDARPFDPRVPAAIRKLKGRPVTVTVLLTGLPSGDPKGDEQAVKILRQLGDVAAEADVRISIYHHTGDWTHSMLHAIEVIKKADHPRVGVNFNLCHWLMVDGEKDYRPVLRENAAKIFAVTINGATIGSKTWADGLIQPLDKGDFDNRELLAVLKEIGYKGPVGLMCYGIGGDARKHLQRSIDTWDSWKK